MKDWEISAITFHNVVANKAGEVLIIQMSVLYGSINYAVMLRGASVDVLTILICDGKRYVVHVSQERIAVGERDQWSNVAGFVDHGETPRDEHSALLRLRRTALMHAGAVLHPGDGAGTSKC